MHIYIHTHTHTHSDILAIKKKNEIFPFVTTWVDLEKKVEVTQLCLTLSDSMNCSPPGSSVHGILQATVLEWVALPFSRGSSAPGIEPWSPTMQVYSLLSVPPGKP